MKNIFTPVAWVHHTNIYEVNIRQYSDAGTLNAFAEHLPRLKDMGVETLWFMPLQPIGKLHRKGTLGSYYSISDYISLNPEYGVLDDFKLLVEEAHRYNMKVIIDWVANHTSWDHVWTQTHPVDWSKCLFVHPHHNPLHIYKNWQEEIAVDPKPQPTPL